MRERTRVPKAQGWAAFLMLSYKAETAKEMLSVLQAKAQICNLGLKLLFKLNVILIQG